jgi:alkylation response protein AidB-like acyl-CoA dehydrogenase
MTILERAKGLAPLLRERAAEGEAARTMPADVVEKVREAGLFHLAMPAALGGPPEEPDTVIQVIEEVSAADGSAGWTVFIGNSTGFVAWLDPDVARQLLAVRPDPVVASVFAPTGQAVPAAPGRFTVSGRWSFTSGAPHADWFVNGVVVMDGDEPRLLDGGVPDWRFAWLPAADVEVLDTWQAAGLRGTGSHDTTATEASVPEEQTIMPLFAPARVDDPLYQLPFFTLLLIFGAGFPLGVARRALDEFRSLAQTKSRRTDRRPLVEDETLQVEVARVEAALGSARAYVFETVGQAWAAVSGGRPITNEERAAVASSVVHAFRAGRQVVDTVFGLAGAGALYETSPLQRCWRDLHAGSQHIAVSIGTERAVGRVSLGLEPNTFLF